MFIILGNYISCYTLFYELISNQLCFKQNLEEGVGREHEMPSSLEHVINIQIEFFLLTY